MFFEWMECRFVRVVFIVGVLSVVLLCDVGYCEDVSDEMRFKSVPTTVKAHENNSVLLPCYLETTNNGKIIFKEVIE